MGLAVYTENQIHERSYHEEAGWWLSRVVAESKSDGLLSGIGYHTDTMFNVVQLNRIRDELTQMREQRPELADDIDRLCELLDVVERQRGYLWIAGD